MSAFERWYNRLVGPLSRWADGLENRAPWWFQWNTWGDPISWIHHFLFVLLLFTPVGIIVGTLVGAVATILGYALGVPALGALTGAALGATIGSGVGVLFYIVRETANSIENHRELGWGAALWRGEPHYTGWLVDSVMDVALPVLAHLIVVSLL